VLFGKVSGAERRRCQHQPSGVPEGACPAVRAAALPAHWPLNWPAVPVVGSQEARTEGVATVAITDRTRLLAFLAGADGEAGAPHAKRARVAGAAGAAQPASCGDGLLPGSDDVSLGTCAQLHDRNSILLSKHKVRARAPAVPRHQLRSCLEAASHAA
jgi:hypothetical protein